VDTLFLHEAGEDYTVGVARDDERVIRAVLEVKATDAGPRPRRFRVKEGTSEEPRPPEQFVEIARRADRIRISEQTDPERRTEVQEMLAGYQLGEKAKAVRTCRYCAGSGEYSPSPR